MCVFVCVCVRGGGQVGEWLGLFLCMRVVRKEEGQVRGDYFEAHQYCTIMHKYIYICVIRRCVCICTCQFLFDRSPQMKVTGTKILQKCKLLVLKLFYNASY